MLVRPVVWWAIVLIAALAALLTVKRRLDARLIAARRRLDLVETTSRQATWECNPEGVITYASPLFEQYFNGHRDSMVGLHLSELTWPEEHARVEQLMRTGDGWCDQRFRCVVSDGEVQWFEGSAVAVRGARGRVVGFLGTCHPVAGMTDASRLNDLLVRVQEAMADEALSIVFQPILSVETGRLVGAEALSRFAGVPQQPPDVWFAEAAEVGLSVDLELHAIHRAMSAALSLPLDIYVSVNVSPATLASAGLLTALTTGPIAPSRLVVEVTEHADIADYAEVLVPLNKLRAHGIRLAVDDAGAGYASFRHILRLTPEIIKLDRSLMTGIDSDPARRALASALVLFASETNASVVAEGIETVAELRAAEAIGIDKGQGYLFGRPTDDWSTWTEWHEHGSLYSVRAAHRTPAEP